MKTFLTLVIASILLASCAVVPKGRYTLASKKPYHTNPLEPKSTTLIIVNDYGNRYVRRVYVDTFTIGDCYMFVKSKK